MFRTAVITQTNVGYATFLLYKHEYHALVCH